ncbi:hypothetical protein HPB50_005888 [Hyalomma asiaticum]|uniref:Uncharacterized protein n=1 Tax=Hyalomma asiaticum TaxID=266040 RepID=A0ACB7S6X0_HYAAI|nr:hypothetical protein HPB50_005888 [Hyalomma asiaticum]
MGDEDRDHWKRQATLVLPVLPFVWPPGPRPASPGLSAAQRFGRAMASPVPRMPHRHRAGRRPHIARPVDGVCRTWPLSLLSLRSASCLAWVPGPPPLTEADR